MPKQDRVGAKPNRAMAGLEALLLIAAASACLAGCAGSSGNNGVFSSTSGSNAEVSDSAGVSAFAETQATPIRSAAASETARKLTAAATPGSSAYRIGPLDMLEVSVFKVPDLSKAVQVGDDGNISYPLIGEVPAAGRTTHELERDLA